MQNRILVLITTLLIGLGGYSQIKLSGVIIDEESGRPVADAHIMLATGIAVTSDSVGQFSIAVDKMPVTLRITHVSYGQSDITLEHWPEGMLVIRIQQMISNLEEVQISAERMRILTEKDDFSLQDFAFDHSFLWMIGHTNNQANKGALFLSNTYGDTISSKSFQGAGQLYKDVFGNVHLVLTDSVHQLYCLSNDSIIFLYSAERKEFIALMDPILAIFSEKLVYKKAIPQSEEVYIYYYGASTSEPQLLTHIVDSLEVVRKLSDSLIMGSMWLDLKKTRYWKRDTKIAEIYEGPVKTPMVSFRDSLYIVNTVKDSLLTYDQYGCFVRSYCISFHKDIKLGNTDLKDLKFLVDNEGERVYSLERKTAGWCLNPIDLQTGSSLQSIPLPNFAGMTQITVFNNAVYFLYPEKKYPYYTRLYRYQL